MNYLELILVGFDNLIPKLNPNTYAYEHVIGNKLDMTQKVN